MATTIAATMPAVFTHFGVVYGVGPSWRDMGAPFSRHIVYIDFNLYRQGLDACYMDAMPKLWSDTVLAHRESVRNATLDAVAALVAQNGLASLTMSDIAQTTGIGRATLYKYFPDVRAVLEAWHQREVASHLELFASLAGGAGSPIERLGQILTIHAHNLSRHKGELAAMLHGSGHVAHAWRHLTASLAALIRDGVIEGEIREDVEPDDLANYCLSAVSGASHLRSRAQVDQIVAVTLSGLKRETMASP